ncbi:MAG: chromosomal replication initiator protein DnaA [Pirellulaceae bacterium]|nr:chromosomal replication initiator protein DnaA [Pirellulaceae bacterium]
MATDDREIVSAVRAALTARVGNERMALWFGRGAELRVTGATLEVRLGESFRLEFVQRSFRADLIAAARTILGEQGEVAFVLDAALAAAATKQPLLKVFAADSPPEATESTPAEAPPAAAPPKNRRQFANLDDFVAGPGSQVALAAAHTAIQQPGTYSPVTFAGPSGCGKTHLLEGIWRRIRTGPGQRRVIYLTAEQFTNQFLEALKHSGTPSFRRKYRDIETLLIDDVQFLANKQSTVVELVHTIDTLVREGRQLVFTSDRPPSELRGLGPELIARLTGGLVCSIQLADGATRLAILRQLASRQPVVVPDEVLTWLASQLAGDARHLTGAMNRLVATSAAVGRPIDLDFAHGVLVDLIHATRRAVSVPEIVAAVCDVFGVGAEDLQSSSKAPAVALPRMLVMFLARKYTRAAHSQIGRSLGRRSHSTVVSAQQKVEEWITTDKQVPLGHGQCTLADAVRRIESRLRLG